MNAWWTARAVEAEKKAKCHSYRLSWELNQRAPRLLKSQISKPSSSYIIAEDKSTFSSYTDKLYNARQLWVIELSVEH